jgi:hypothetical protein
MAKGSNHVKWIVAAGAILLFGVLVHSTFDATRIKYEVCMAFKGATHCSTAAGASAEDAIRSAQGIDCQLLTNGRDELMVCMDTAPTVVRELK